MSLEYVPASACRVLSGGSCSSFAPRICASPWQQALGDPLTTTFNFSDFFCECVITFCIKEGSQTNNSTMYASRKVLRSYHGKVIQFLVCLLEGLYVAGRQHWVIHQIGCDDVLAPELGHQQLLGTGGPCGLPRRWLLGTCKSRCFQYINT
jgi:hypothetical protein